MHPFRKKVACSLVWTHPVVEGLIRASIGKAQLLINKRFPQFRELCNFNKDSEAAVHTTDSDLEGYWDLITFDFSVHVFPHSRFSLTDIEDMFSELAALRGNNWEKPAEEIKEVSTSRTIELGTKLFSPRRCLRQHQRQRQEIAPSKVLQCVHHLPSFEELLPSKKQRSKDQNLMLLPKAKSFVRAYQVAPLC